MSLDVMIKNAEIITMDEKGSICNWMGISGGKIVELGKGDCTAEAKQVIDAKGAAVLPGLSDCHVHVMCAGMNLEGVKLQDCCSIEEVLAEMEERCGREPGDGWIYGVNFIPQKIKENRYPTKWELDAICHGHKIILFAATMHGCALNSRGLQIAAVPEETPGVVKKNGEPIGVFDSDESAFIANINVFGSLTDDEIWRFIQLCAEDAVKKGVTTIHGLFGAFVKGDRDLEIVMRRKEQLPLNMIEFYQTWDVEAAQKKGLPRVGGCLTLDGAIFEYTMANYEPYLTEPALRGVLYHSDEEVYRFISDAHRADMQCTMHAVGERAIDQLLYTYHRVFMEQGRKSLRHRIEHFCLPTKEQIKMASELNLILSMQPGFSYLWDCQTGGAYEEMVGRERADRMDPFAEVLQQGNRMIGGSDCPVTPVDPLRDIAACVKNPNPKRNIPMKEALKMYTVNAAYALNLEEKKGSLEVGKDADLVVVDRNPFACAGTEELYNIKVLYTMKDGCFTYEK